VLHAFGVTVFKVCEGMLPTSVNLNWMEISSVGLVYMETLEIRIDTFEETVDDGKGGTKTVIKAKEEDVCFLVNGQKAFRIIDYSFENNPKDSENIGQLFRRGIP
jgi:hypothetical protein